jgi:peptidylprolyl isomerase
MTIAKRGDTVHVHYTGRLDDGSVFDDSAGRDPLAFTLGAGQVIGGFERAIEGMAVGARRTVRIPVAEAYGERRPEALLQVQRTELPDGLDVELGARLEMHRNGQAMPVVVVAADAVAITLDANHPLAGRALTFDLHLVSIAPRSTSGPA